MHCMIARNELKLYLDSYMNTAHNLALADFKRSATSHPLFIGISLVIPTERTLLSVVVKGVNHFKRD